MPWRSRRRHSTRFRTERPAAIVEETFTRHIGPEVGRLCDWVDRALEAPGALDSHYAAIRVLDEAQSAGGDGVPPVLPAVCGYYGDAATLEANPLPAFSA